ncbi:c-type cytochrome [Bosea sp. (in: a-proteobacteria)]|uniref:c-type cytochrome n=1 Tax=Bosea sp. (in: a-proteobacteria) TaxID=1871050 RepID=UPI0026300E0D|nr:c-type cytochrome [Bosea sp. (in: a-proteobacteria)]MCO5090894.1 cytochrome c [Bosea sp. (in: a-proteobacteria)]
MKKAALLAGLAAAAIVGTNGFASDLFDRIDAGRYNAVLADCAACHTRPGGKPFAGGAPLQTPFGALVPANITPDPETGIGSWSYADFRNALKTGIGKDGKRLYPAMPYPAYATMADADVADLWAYFQKVEPVSNRVVSNQLPFPFSIRAAMIGWNLLNFSPKEFQPDPAKPAEWNRGAYLVNGPAHCGTCHTPKNLTGADKSGEFLRGGNLQNWYAPNLTSDPHKGLGNWSGDDIVAYLKTGSNRFDIASGPMAEAIRHSTSLWNDADLKAVATYLKDVKGSDAAAPQPIAATEPAMTAGKAIYLDRCSACHVSTGTGEASLFPTLAKAPVVNGTDPTSLIRVVLQGSQAAGTPAKPTTPAMPSFGWNLSDADVANVLTYVRNSWGNAAPPVTAGQVKDLRVALTR